MRSHCKHFQSVCFPEMCRVFVTEGSGIQAAADVGRRVFRSFVAFRLRSAFCSEEAEQFCAKCSQIAKAACKATAAAFAVRCDQLGAAAFHQANEGLIAMPLIRRSFSTCAWYTLGL